MPKRWSLALHATVTAVLLSIAVCFCFYPAVIVARVVLDPRVRTSGETQLILAWFDGATGRYADWARAYLVERRAEKVDPSQVAATEWPLFGSVFFLLAAEELTQAGRVQRDARLDAALALAAEVVAAPASGTWVKQKWGADYLQRENVFYRMLVILGLSSYERITGRRAYHELVMGQARSLSQELLRAPRHLADDYPGECYPSDVLWAVVAIQRAARLEGGQARALATAVLSTLDGPARTPSGIPAFEVDAETATVDQEARGSGNSGLLSMAAELDPEVASRWYAAHERHFWSGDGWAWGFREVPPGSEDLADVDSGPVIFGLGTVASAFGIGAARSVGRLDHAAPLLMQTVAAAWPTPFGFAVPGFVGWLGADSASLGELALLFTMTRPTAVAPPRPFTGPTPPIVWVFLAGYALVGLAIVLREALWWRRRGADRRGKEETSDP